MGLKTIVGYATLATGVILMSWPSLNPQSTRVEEKRVPIYMGDSPRAGAMGGGSQNTGDPNSPPPFNQENALIGEDTPPSEYGKLLSQGAYDSIGISTAGIAGTQNGALGCAAATCIMFQNTTGQQLVPGKNIVLGTGELYSSLSSDSRFVAVSVSNAQPGDIIITARNSSTGRAGHTGIVVNDGRIISNSSSGFAGSAPGTIQNNYTIDDWQSSVTTRNPSQTTVFRYIGG